LSESADDLINLEENIADLLENETYRNHIIAKGKLYYMIAKSDTQRRDGVGAHFAQEFAVEKVTNIVARRATKYPSLQNVKLIPFNGAGHALQRGGGRIDEIPNIYAKAAMRGLYWLKNKHDFNILPPALTTQGHQNGILFSYANCVNFLTSYFSQSLYAKFKMRGLIADSEIPNVEARKYRESFFNAARKNYWEEVSTLSSPINLLFTQGPWASVELSNVSSRPSKRVENYALQLIDQRAIGTEKMCAHSGTHLISWYSARAGLEEIGLKAGRFMYLNDKATRDSFRNIAMSLFMCDFEISWKMMIGKNHPKLEEIENLAAKYKQNQITLAHLEIEAIKTAALIHKIIVNEDLICSLTPQNLLNELWPNLANRIKNREKKLKFTHLIEAKLTFNLPENEKRYPNNSQLKQLFRAINAACTGSEAPNITLIRSINRDFVSEFENDLNSDLVEKLSIV
jgi:phosphoenolpyruvate carboxylase